jgi:hypothetical protein
LFASPAVAGTVYNSARHKGAMTRNQDNPSKTKKWPTNKKQNIKWPSKKQKQKKVPGYRF